MSDSDSDDYLPSDTSSHNSADNYESDVSMEDAVSSAAEDGQSEQTSDEEQQSASVSDESEEDAGGDGSGDGSSGLFVYPEPGCGKSYTKIKSWRSHKDAHAREYYCQICPYRGGDFDMLTRHVRTHTNERPYHCEYPGCSKTYKESGHLRRHQKTALVHLRAQIQTVPGAFMSVRTSQVTWKSVLRKGAAVVGMVEA
ncbi:uncharacterized protein EHS24_006400 [Apiotrichum porosum]|uniref:C2H2-type domain-containing protein n=1 Tax=Apiotrichum porosum TaxID=105984 RepID=A0A427Y1B0_9TREE|nr:uncharacterized protein EHS24_006400 [Apiotrichum porosum]RSH84867.1 hypothetical protein EHS24_006400 [Apiotrichum porosum]